MTCPDGPASGICSFPSDMNECAAPFPTRPYQPVREPPELPGASAPAWLSPRPHIPRPGRNALPLSFRDPCFAIQPTSLPVVHLEGNDASSAVGGSSMSATGSLTRSSRWIIGLILAVLVAGLSLVGMQSARAAGPC